VFSEFRKRADIYRKNTGRPAVLVLDNVNRLGVGNPGLLQFLQDVAKDAADNRSFVTVFVTSEGHAPLQMLGMFLPWAVKAACDYVLLTGLPDGIARSAKSRLGKVVSVDDISYLEAKAFLNKKGGKACELLEEIFDLVGGRIKLIESINHDLEDGVSWAGKWYIIK